MARLKLALAWLLIAGGTVLCFAGAWGIGAYVIGVIEVIGAADRSWIFWGLVFLLWGLIVLVAGIGAIIGGTHLRRRLRDGR